MVIRMCTVAGVTLEPANIGFYPFNQIRALSRPPRSPPPARSRRPPHRRTLPICRTCSGDEMPKPSAMGSDVAARMRARQRLRAVGHRVARAGDAEPRDAIQKPAPEPRRLSACARRSSSGSAERSCRCRAAAIASRKPPASSIGRSSTSTPSTPASRARSPNASTPILSTGLAYVKSTIGALTVDRTRATRSSTPDAVAPAASARSVAR